MSCNASNRDPAHYDIGRTLSPFAQPSATRLRLMIRDEVRNCLRTEHGREEPDGGKLQGGPGSKGHVTGHSQCGRRGGKGEPTSPQTAQVDQGLAGTLVPIFLLGFLAVIWLLVIVDWLELHMKLSWEYTHIDVPYLGSVPILRAMSLTFLFVQ
ncbi:hypothetical protein HDZ31DRAFT_69428 [Schizophyllum fasciatum]